MSVSCVHDIDNIKSGQATYELTLCLEQRFGKQVGTQQQRQQASTGPGFLLQEP